MWRWRDCLRYNYKNIWKRTDRCAVSRRLDFGLGSVCNHTHQTFICACSTEADGVTRRPSPRDFIPIDQILRRLLLMFRITQALYLRNITCVSFVFDVYLLQATRSFVGLQWYCSLRQRSILCDSWRSSRDYDNLKWGSTSARAEVKTIVRSRSAMLCETLCRTTEVVLGRNARRNVAALTDIESDRVSNVLSNTW